MRKFEKFEMFSCGFKMNDISKDAEGNIHSESWHELVWYILASKKNLKRFKNAAGQMGTVEISKAIVDFLRKLVEDHESKGEDNE